MDDISLSARERRTLHQLEKVLRRQDRLVFRLRPAGRRAGPPEERSDRRRHDEAGREIGAGPANRGAGAAGRAAGRGPGRGLRALIALSASLMLLAIRTSGRGTRHLTALAFGAVWLLATALAPRPARR